MIRASWVLLLVAVAACTPLSEQRTALDDAAASQAAALRTAAPEADAALAPWLDAQRERVARERSAAQARYESSETQCWQRFAVNACLSEARQERRATLYRLRRQELALNDIERQRRTQQRLRELDEKQRAR